MNQKKMAMMVSGKREEGEKIYESFGPTSSPEKGGTSPRKSFVDASKKGNVGLNLF